MFNELEEIREAKGKTKQAVMLKYPDLKPVFKYACDPFLKYNLDKKKVEALIDDTSDGDMSLNENNFETLKLISQRKTADPLYWISLIASNLTKENKDIFRRIINKDLEVGVGRKTVEKVWPDLLSWTEDGYPKIPVMLCKGFDPKKVKYPCYISIKKDGVRARYIHGNLYTRTGKIIKGMEHITDYLKLFDAFDLDGELYVPGKEFDETSGLIRSDNPTLEAIYYIFDFLHRGGNKSERCRKAIAILDPTQGPIKLAEQVPCFDSTQGPIKLAEQVPCFDYSQLLTQHEENLDAGEEGSVVCNIDSLYEDKRSWNWMRLVPKPTADLKCVGFDEGTGKNKGKLGAIIVEYKSVRVRVGTGFSDEDRVKIWNRPQDYLGETAEIEYKKESKFGALRQPVFKCWRWDK